MITLFVTATLRVVQIPGAFVRDDQVCIIFGREPAWRLTPTTYANLFHAAERRCAQLPHDHPDTYTLAAALDVIYDALLIAGYPPASIRPWTPETPPLPTPPKIPPDQAWEPDKRNSEDDKDGELNDTPAAAVPFRPAPPPVRLPTASRSSPTKRKGAAAAAAKDRKERADIGGLF